MLDQNPVHKRLLLATLKSLLTIAESSKWGKAGGTFIAELAEHSRDLSDQEKGTLFDASDTELRDALTQIDLTAKHSAFTAAGIVRIEDQVAALRSAIEEADTPRIIKFPGATITQNMNGDGNIVAAIGDIHIGKIDMRRTAKRSKQAVLPGTVGTDAYKAGYLLYLADRYNKFKEAEMGKTEMNYALIYVAYKREMKFSIKNTPLDLFERSVAWLQHRIANTVVGRTQGRKGNRLFETFDEFVKRQPNPDASTASS